MKLKLKKSILEIEDEVINLRRKIHQNPELGFEVQETANLISNYLKKLGIEVTEKVGKNGVVGLLKGNNADKTLAIRADMDAIPIQEETNLEFKSQNDGIMHACGHDGHVAIALGTAKILSQIKEKINGNIKFIFQPAEEKVTGAKAMIEDNVLENPKVDAIMGLHIWPDLKSGKIGIKEGPIMAAVDEFHIEVIGKGGHGAIPNKAVDPIVIASEIVGSLQKIVSREIDPLKAGVITVGTFNGGSSFNVIPDRVKMSGTVRTFDQEVRSFINQRIEKILKSSVEGNRANYDLNYKFAHPSTNNDKKLTNQFIKKLKEVFETENIITNFESSMGGEDFSLYQQEVPGTYMFLGTKNNKKNKTYPIHHPKYDIDESILKYGVEVFTNLAIDFFNCNN